MRIRDRFIKRLFMFAFAAMLVFPALLGQLGKINPFDPLGQTKPAQEITLSEKRKTHLLYGDATGGGHLYGMNKLCASEFPAAWRAEQVVERVLTHANDNLDWKQQKNGNYVAEVTDGPLRIRIVIDSRRQEIVTAYPVNVKRNPCDRRPANDN